MLDLAVRKHDVELVIAYYDDDLSWTDVLKPLRTIYTKVTPSRAGAIALPNVGREQRAFVAHTLRNYDRLAARTVFMHGRAPSCGFFVVETIFYASEAASHESDEEAVDVEEKLHGGGYADQASATFFNPTASTSIEAVFYASKAASLSTAYATPNAQPSAASDSYRWTMRECFIVCTRTLNVVILLLMLFGANASTRTWGRGAMCVLIFTEFCRPVLAAPSSRFEDHMSFSDDKRQGSVPHWPKVS